MPIAGVRGDAVAAASEQGGRAPGISAHGVGQPDRDLGESLPQVAFARRPLLPQCFERLVGVEWLAGVEVTLREVDRLGHCQVELVGHPLDPAVRVARQRPTERVAGAGVARSTRWVAVAFMRRQRLRSISSSQCVISPDTTLGASSCKKWPASSTMRQL